MALRNLAVPQEFEMWVQATAEPLRRAALLAANPALSSFVRELEEHPLRIRQATAATAALAVTLLSEGALTEVLRHDSREQVNEAARRTLARYFVDGDPGPSQHDTVRERFTDTTIGLLSTSPEEIAASLESMRKPASRVDLRQIADWCLIAEAESAAVVVPALLPHLRDTDPRFRSGAQIPDLVRDVFQRLLPALASVDLEATRSPRYEKLLAAITSHMGLVMNRPEQVEQWVVELEGVDRFVAEALRESWLRKVALFASAHPVTEEGVQVLSRSARTWPALVTLGVLSPFDAAAVFTDLLKGGHDRLDLCDALEILADFVAAVPPAVDETTRSRHVYLRSCVEEALRRVLGWTVGTKTRPGARLPIHNVCGAALGCSGLDSDLADACLIRTSMPTLVAFVLGRLENKPTAEQLERAAVLLGDRSNPYVGTQMLTSSSGNLVLLHSEFADVMFDVTPNMFVDTYRCANRADSVNPVARFLIERVCAAVDMTESRWATFFALAPTFTGTGRDMVELLNLM